MVGKIQRIQAVESAMLVFSNTGRVKGVHAPGWRRGECHKFMLATVPTALVNSTTTAADVVATTPELTAHY